MRGIERGNKIMELESTLKNIQIITLQVNAEKLDGTYYSKLKNKIKKQIRENDFLLINLVPKKPIKSRAQIKILLDLQLEFTDVVIMPKSTLHSNEVDDWIDFFQPSQILRHVV
jgi:hypothetical protein